MHTRVRTVRHTTGGGRRSRQRPHAARLHHTERPHRRRSRPCSYRPHGRNSAIACAMHVRPSSIVLDSGRRGAEGIAKPHLAVADLAAERFGSVDALSRAVENTVVLACISDLAALRAGPVDLPSEASRGCGTASERPRTQEFVGQGLKLFPRAMQTELCLYNEQRRLCERSPPPS